MICYCAEVSRLLARRLKSLLLTFALTLPVGAAVGQQMPDIGFRFSSISQAPCPWSTVRLRDRARQTGSLSWRDLAQAID
jgi:hypothetical protein